ncbi:MAG: L,D-transpeptidase family protein, partial [Pseudomonadota bacterium]
PTAGKAIVVNVPAFELIAFEDGEPVLRSRVIVGAPWHPTPLLRTTTSTVRFRPTWRPTPSMVASGEYEDRVWPPGERNPLGLAAIRFADGGLVYLHDTNRRSLFEREQRALSHGCIRVQRWDELIAWLLDWNLADVHRLAQGRATVDVPTPPVPVIIGSYTTFPDDDGRPERFPDIYDRSPTTAPRPACG